MPLHERVSSTKPSTSSQSRHHAPSPKNVNKRQPSRDSSRNTNFQQQRSQDPSTDAHVNSRMKLLTNSYSISTADRNNKVYEYELFIEISKNCTDLPPKVLSRTFVARSLRKLIIDAIVPQLVRNHIPMGSVLIDPNLSAIFTLFPLKSLQPSVDSTNSEAFVFRKINVASDLLAILTVDIHIKYLKTFKLTVGNYSINLLSSIIHHQLLTDMLRYESVYYLSEENPGRAMERLDLMSRHLMGISISGARRSTNNQTLVVVSSSHSYITQAHRLIDLLASFVAGSPITNFNHDYRSCDQDLALHSKIISIDAKEQNFLEFCSILLGFKCRSRDFEGKDVNLRFNLTDDSAAKLYIDKQTKTSVYDLYRSSGIELNYPNLPCLQTRSKTFPYYPFELCNLMSGQKVPIFRLSTQARQHLLSLNKPHPNLSWINSVQARDEIAARNKEQFKNFGVILNETPVEAYGSTLNKPILQYKNRMVFPTHDYWESARFYDSVDLNENWCLVDTVGLNDGIVRPFFKAFSQYASKLGLRIGPASKLDVPKQEIVELRVSIEAIIEKCSRTLKRDLKFIMFIIDANSTFVNRSIHLAFDDNPNVTATCIRSDSILNIRLHRSIFRTLVHKLNSRLGGTNFIYDKETWARLSLDCRNLMIIGLDVTHPDNELSGVSIVGCAYTYSEDLFKHRSLVWPQAARKEMITKMDSLMERLLGDYKTENKNKLPHHIVIYRDGVSHEEFDRVRSAEISQASDVIERISRSSNLPKPNLSYIIAQKRHTTRFFRPLNNNTVRNPPGGTLIDQGIVPQEGREFYLYSNTSPQATARPLHYHVLLNGLGMENLQKLTYYLCFNFGKCSSSLSMPSSLRYAHNAAYDARNRVIASREFCKNKFYTTKFFC